MKKVTAFATFVALAAGATVVSAALPNPSMRGSDTLFEIYANPATDAPGVLGGIIKNCPGAAAITYIGSGSGNGQTDTSAVPPARARVAPMSRHYNNGICANPQASDAEGIAFALDGLAIIAAGERGDASGTPLCSAGAQDCDRGTDANSGLAYSRTIAVSDQNGTPGVQCISSTYVNTKNVTTTACTNAYQGGLPVRGSCAAGQLCLDTDSPTDNVGNFCGTITKSATAKTVTTPGCAAADATTYTVQGWRDVLRILYAGMPMGDNTQANRDCNSDLRFSLANSYASVFQTDCTQGNCTQVKHMFRRDEFSGTTDVFLGLLLLPTIAPETFETISGYNYPTVASAFCNVRRNTDTWDSPTPPYGRNEQIGTALNVPDGPPYYPEFQDEDPIRRTCDGDNNAQGILPPFQPPTVAAHEQVCGARGTLGLVLPISIPTSQTLANQYPTEVCSLGAFAVKSGPVRADGTVEFCPNGDKAIGGVFCYYPTTTSGDTRCMNGRDNRPAFALDRAHALLTNVDGRVYNLTLHTGTGSDDIVKVSRVKTDGVADGATEQVRHIGAFYRIHQTRTLTAPFDAHTCQQNDDTQQIACLVAASKCSLGYAGLEGPALQAGAFDVKLNALDATPACVQKLLDGGSTSGNDNPTAYYPVSRKLYLNTVIGFEEPTSTAAGQYDPAELELAKCTAAVTDARITRFGFIPMPETHTNPAFRNPFCEDYNQASNCTGAQANNPNACAAHFSGVGCDSTANTQGTCAAGKLCVDIGDGDPNGDVCATACDQAAGTLGASPCTSIETCVDTGDGDANGDACLEPANPAGVP